MSSDDEQFRQQEFDRYSHHQPSPELKRFRNKANTLSTALMLLSLLGGGLV